MKKKFNPTCLAIWVNRFIALVLTALLFVLPVLLDWYSTVRALNSAEYTAIAVAFYCCAAVVAIALCSLDRLLRSIRAGDVFIRKNVRRIRILQWCCALVSLICLPAACIYYPLIFMVVIMGFLALVVCVVCRVMDAAVTIREENDLTI